MREDEKCIWLNPEGVICGNDRDYPLHVAAAYPDSLLDYHVFKTQAELTPTGFLRARLDEMESRMNMLPSFLYYQVKNLIESHREMIDMYEAWPVFVETQPEYDFTGGYDTISMVVSQQQAWFTQNEYAQKFGTEPPMNGLIRAMLVRYSKHPNFNPEWVC